jgi:hypothetical protein
MDLSSDPEAMVRLSGDQARTLMPARWPVRVLSSGKGEVVEWMLIVASAEAEARYAPQGEKRMEVMPRAWEQTVPLGMGLKFRRFEEMGGGVGVRAGGGRSGNEFELEDRERGVPSLLVMYSLLFRLPREGECACHDLRLRSRSSLSLLLADLVYSLLCCRRLDSNVGLWVARCGLGDTTPEGASEEWLDVLLRFGAGLSMSMVTLCLPVLMRQVVLRSKN